jgi:prevent-host-death family protein
MKTQNAVKTIEALEARVHFGSVMDEVEKKNTRFLVSKRGKPKIIMLSVTDYLENILKEDELLTKIHLKTKETGLDKISEEEIEKEILASRRKRAGKNRQLKRV